MDILYGDKLNQVLYYQIDLSVFLFWTAIVYSICRCLGLCEQPMIVMLQQLERELQVPGVTATSEDSSSNATA